MNFLNCHQTIAYLALLGTLLLISAVTLMLQTSITLMQNKGRFDITMQKLDLRIWYEYV